MMLRRHTPEQPGTDYDFKRVRRLAHAPHWNRARRYISAAFCIYLAILCVGILEVVMQQQTLNRYRLDGVEQQILGHDASAKITSKLKFDAQAQAYQFNAGYTPAANAETLGAADYTATLPTDMRTSGISLTDPSSKITVTLKPQFASLPAKAQGGRVVYPLEQGGATMVYSVKSNGLKEDIIIPAFMGDELQFSYQLSLPAGVEARLTPDGSVGIYTGDPALFGNVSTGTASDKALLDKARQNSPKTNLAFVIPAPTVKDATGPSLATARFQLEHDRLTVKVTNLQKASYPLSVDPSLVLPGSDGWSNGNNEDNTIDYSTSGQIGGPPITGGDVGTKAVSGNGSLTIPRYKFATVVLYGRIYVIGGVNGSNSTVGGIEYATILSNGAESAWTTSSVSLPTARFVEAAVAYNGYIYVIGGNTGGGLITSNTVIYNKVNQSDGSLASGTWSVAAGLNAPRQDLQAVAYQGKLYALGGLISSGTATNSMEYASVRADGSLSSWTTSTTTLPSSLFDFSATVYNSNAYIVGGYTANSSNAFTSAVDYINLSVNGDTSIGSGWVATTNIKASIFGENITAYGGYLYSYGGCTGQHSTNVGECEGSSPYSEICNIFYAPLYADGSVGAWTTTVKYNAACAEYAGFVADGQNHLIGVGGCNVVNNFSHVCSTSGGMNGTSNYTSINAAGDTGPGSSPTTTSTYSARVGAASVIANGYLYVVGGCSVAAVTCNSDTTKLLGDTARLRINPDGSLGNAGCGQGAWCDDATHLLPAAKTSSPCASTFGRSNGALTYSNGWLYYVGGLAANGSITCNKMQVMNDVLLVKVNSSDGSLNGNWFQSGNTFDPTSQHAGSTGVLGTSALVWHEYLYIFGGNDPFWQGSGENTSLIWYSPINQANGSPGAFTTNPNNLPDFLSGASMVVSHGYLVVMGGFGGYGGTSSAKANVWTVKMPAAGGAIPAFSATPNSTMPAASYQGIGWTVGDRVYYAGGGDTTSIFSAIYSAAVASDGSIGSWMTASNSLPNTRNRFSGDYAYGQLYVTGGCTASSCTPVNSTDTVPVNYGGNGSPGTWGTSGSTMNTGRFNGVFAVANGYMYAIGGCTTADAGYSCKTATNSVEYAPINTTTGDVGPWTPATGTVTAVWDQAVAVSDGYIYIISGCTVVSTCSHTFNIQYAYANGNIASWQTASVSSPVTEGAAAVATGGYIYTAGSNNTGSYYAQILPNHDLGAWQTGPSLLTNTWLSNLVTNGSYLYMLNYDSNVQNPTYAHSDIEYAPINADHSIGAWQWTTSSTLTRQGPYVAGIADGYVYVAGGYTDSNGFGNMSSEYAPIMSDGSLGEWQYGSSMTVGAVNTSGVVYNGHIYSVGGSAPSSSSLTSVRYATLQVQAHTGHYSKMFATDKNTLPVNYFVTSVSPQGAAIITAAYQTATLASPVFGGAGSSSGLVSGAKYPVTISGDGVAYYWINLTIDDTLSASFGSPVTSISYFQLNYHPNPTMRLRGGKTFNSNKLQGLDAP